MNMDQVFKGLPQVIQWEILTEFVGGFAVRYNRLRRFMTGDLQKKIMKYNFEQYDISTRNLWAKHIVYSPIPFRLEHLVNTSRRRVYVGLENGLPEFQIKYSDVHQAIALTEFSRRETFVVLFKERDTEKLSYGYYCWGREWFITPIDDSVILPPFVKHYYPSYPYTNKKLGRPGLKMKLHVGNAVLMAPWRYSEWKSGRQWWEEEEEEEDDGRVNTD